MHIVYGENVSILQDIFAMLSTITVEQNWLKQNLIRKLIN